MQVSAVPSQMSPMVSGLAGAVESETLECDFFSLGDDEVDLTTDQVDIEGDCRGLEQINAQFAAPAEPRVWFQCTPRDSEMATHTEAPQLQTVALDGSIDGLAQTAEKGKKQKMTYALLSSVDGATTSVDHQTLEPEKFTTNEDRDLAKSVNLASSDVPDATRQEELVQGDRVRAQASDPRHLASILDDAQQTDAGPGGDSEPFSLPTAQSDAIQAKTSSKQISIAPAYGISKPSVPQQIAIAISEIGNGTTELALSPEELGKVRIRLDPTGDTIIIHVTAERADTQDLIRRNLTTFGHELLDLGFSNVSFSFGEKGHDKDPEHPERTPKIVLLEVPEQIPRAPQVAATGLDLRL